MPLLSLPKPPDWTFATGTENISNIGAGLSYDLNVYDNFDDNSIDPAKWTEYDSGSNVNEVNQRIEISGNNTWIQNGLASTVKTIRKDWGIRGTLTMRSLSNIYFGFEDRATLDNPGLATYTGVVLVFGGAGTITPFVDGVSQGAKGSGYSATNDYTVRIVYDNPGFRIYIQSTTDGNYSTETLLQQDTTYCIVGSVYVQLAMFDSTATKNYFDDSDITSYLTTSPVAESPWFTIDQTTLDATTPISIEENAIGGLLGVSAGSIKYQYATNNGAYNGSWVTLAAMNTALQGVSITDSNSLRIKAQFTSNGTQAADIGGFGSYAQAAGSATGGGNKSRLVNAGVK